MESLEKDVNKLTHALELVKEVRENLDEFKGSRLHYIPQLLSTISFEINEIKFVLEKGSGK